MRLSVPVGNMGDRVAEKLYPSVNRAINKAMTPGFDRWAKKKYGMSGKKLLAKVAKVEGGGTSRNPNVSSAKARGPFQFIPSTRAAYKSKYGIDAWADDTSAAKAAMIHLEGTGVAGYNPGMPSYEGNVLRASVDTSPLKTGGYGRSGSGKGGGGSPTSVDVNATAPTTTRETVGPGGTGLAGLLGQLREREKESQQPQSQGLEAPAHSAQAALPKGYTPVESGPPPPEKTPLSDMLDQVKGLEEEGIAKSQVTPGSADVKVTGGGGGGGRGVNVPSGGKVVGEPMDRPGVPTSKHVTELVRRASAWSDQPIQLGTGSQHKKISASGNVSAHWGGNAIDLPVGTDTKKGERVAGAVLVQLGVPRKQARKLAQKGTPYTHFKKGKRSWQVLWKTDADHRDHVHVGFRG